MFRECEAGYRQHSGGNAIMKGCANWTTRGRNVRVAECILLEALIVCVSYGTFEVRMGASQRPALESVLHRTLMAAIQAFEGKPKFACAQCSTTVVRSEYSAHFWETLSDPVDAKAEPTNSTCSFDRRFSGSIRDTDSTINTIPACYTALFSIPRSYPPILVCRLPTCFASGVPLDSVGRTFAPTKRHRSTKKENISLNGSAYSKTMLGNWKITINPSDIGRWVAVPSITRNETPTLAIMKVEEKERKETCD
ncbi:13144_t:CDS:2, partial [Acaulospora colombiana]